MKILESRAKSFYKLKNIKILRRDITGPREVENNVGTFHTEKRIGGTKRSKRLHSPGQSFASA